MAVPFMDLSSSNDAVMDDFLQDLKELFTTGQFVLGPAVQKFEDTFAKFIGVRHMIGVGSGTDALVLALRSLNVGAGDEVICPAFGFSSPAEAVARVGATPVFVDVRPDSFTLDPDKTLATITQRTKAIIPVHLFGQAAEIERIVTIARTYSVSVVEDVRQATGARLGNRRIGTYGAASVYSFHPNAPLSGAGDGGAIAMNDDDRATLLRKLRDHGRLPGGEHEFIGYNTRLDSIQAALLQQKLLDLDENNMECIENARLYNRKFMGSPVQVPYFTDNGDHVYNAYTILVPDRDKLVENLKEKGIGCSVLCPEPVHRQPAFQYLGYQEGAFPIAEDLCRRAVALPITPGLKKHHIEEVADAILSFYGVATA
ncbi:DegT/DnrJ/EryC1/StrS family aminotransferase [bacterium]|nr:DegT/DnrJ/EryC1/StrS family aminotransferase [bacterium]